MPVNIELSGALKMIEVRNLSKSYGSIKAVNVISLSIGKGELFGFLGSNGSGKTTMIKMLTGQIKPTSGSVRMLGVDVLEDPIRVRELAGIVPEQETHSSFLTAEEYLYFVAKIRKMENYEKACEKWFEFLDFGDQKNSLCKDLSRGTRQKLIFAQAFLHEPELVIIVESQINLDPVAEKSKEFSRRPREKRRNSFYFNTYSRNYKTDLYQPLGSFIKESWSIQAA
ncbi:ABC transporter, ATP-binding protein [Methanosarcina barkeri MS]|uniref:ABC transporter, ATP-binding protein n=3 Tax=Methanosarcina TaxID=2207 RepID=A0A0E3QVM2_METBA|nr:ABC transporter, ATP-binding protein [Methanosarcina barkeri MS]